MAIDVLGISRVSQRREQFRQLLDAAVYISDNVEGAVIRPAVGPERRALDNGGIHFLGSAQYIDIAESLAPQILQTLTQLSRLVADDVRAEVTVRSIPVAVLAEPFRQVEHNGGGQRVMLLGQFQQRFARFRLDVSGVNDDHLPSPK